MALPFYHFRQIAIFNNLKLICSSLVFLFPLYPPQRPTLYHSPLKRRLLLLLLPPPNRMPQQFTTSQNGKIARLIVLVKT
jgi:hypothetical protein